MTTSSFPASSHFKDGQNTYCQYELPFGEYTNYEALCQRAGQAVSISKDDVFITLTDAEQMEINDMFGGKNDSPGSV